jgi:hypothetical protein
MKTKVNLQTAEKEYQLADLTDDMIIGVEFIDSRRGFIAKVAHKNLVCFIGFDPMSDYEFLTTGVNVKDLIPKLDCVINIYVFDTKKELYLWLAGAES